MKRALFFTYLLFHQSLFSLSGENASMTLHAGPVMFPDDPPVAVCQDITISTSENCITMVNPEQIDNGSYDPDSDSLIFTLSPEGPFGPGDHEVVLTVTDTTGLFDQCTAHIFVVDDVVPSVVTQSIEVFLDSDGQASITASDLDAGSADNCGIETLSLDVYDFNCSLVGENQVTLTVTDFSGNMASSTDTVYVYDRIAPVLTVISDALQLWPPNHDYETFDVMDFVVEIWDNCPISEEQVHIFRVTSDEPENSNGDGNTVDDIVIGDDCRSVSLRKERMGGSNGRVYTIYLALNDENGQGDTAMCQVYVPHNQGSTPVDDGEEYEIIAECDAISGLPGDNETGELSEPQLTNFPNPFSGSTVIELVMPEPGQVDLEVYNLDGAKVRVLFKGMLTAGDHQFIWDGKNADGIEAQKGIFLLQLFEKDKAVIRRIVKM